MKGDTMKGLTILISAFLIALTAQYGYCRDEIVHEHQQEYTTWVPCKWNTVKTLKTSGIRSTPYPILEMKTSNMQNSKVVFRIRNKNGAMLYENVTTISKSFGQLKTSESDYPISIESMLFCNGAGLWKKVKAKFTVRQFSAKYD
jgi:hypothetical protein